MTPTTSIKKKKSEQDIKNIKKKFYSGLLLTATEKLEKKINTPLEEKSVMVSLLSFYSSLNIYGTCRRGRRPELAGVEDDLRFPSKWRRP